MTDAIIDGVYEDNLTTMAEHVLLVPARDIHHWPLLCWRGGAAASPEVSLMALVAIQVCGYQLLRRNVKSDFERSSSGVIGGTDDQLALQSSIAMRNAW